MYSAIVFCAVIVVIGRQAQGGNVPFDLAVIVVTYLLGTLQASMISTALIVIVVEKESKMKAVQEINGLPTSIYWASWLIYFMAYVAMSRTRHSPGNGGESGARTLSPNKMLDSGWALLRHIPKVCSERRPSGSSRHLNCSGLRTALVACVLAERRGQVSRPCSAVPPFAGPATSAQGVPPRLHDHLRALPRHRLRHLCREELLPAGRRGADLPGGLG